MKVSVDTYDNRIEVTIPVPDGVESVEGGATIREDRDDEGTVTARTAVWCFARDADAKSAATECARLLVASSPGDTAEPAEEQPVKSQTVNVSL